MFGVSTDQVSSEQRRYAKVINFGLIYGQGAFGLAENLGITRTESKEIIDSYLSKSSKDQEVVLLNKLALGSMFLIFVLAETYSYVGLSDNIMFVISGLIFVSPYVYYFATRK